MVRVIDSLHRLHEMDCELYGLRTHIAGAPKKLAEAEQALAGREAEAAAAREEAKQAR